MATYLILGATYAFASAVQPGPFQTFLITQSLSSGWRRTLPAALAPLLSDGPIILLVLFVLGHLSPRLEQLLHCAGGVFLLYLAVRAGKSWRNYQGKPSATGVTAFHNVLSAALVNLLNPNPYLGWSLVMGPLLLKGWHETPVNGLALLISFYCTMVFFLALIIVLFSLTGNIGPRIGRGLVGLSAIALAGWGVFQLWSAYKAFGVI